VPALREADGHAVQRANGRLALAVHTGHIGGGDEERGREIHAIEPTRGRAGCGTASRTSALGRTSETGGVPAAGGRPVSPARRGRGHRPAPPAPLRAST